MHAVGTRSLSIVLFFENGIQCFWDEKRGVLFLHTVTYLDTAKLCQLAKSLDENCTTTENDADPASWLVASGELAAEACRLIALLFHLCHIIVLSSPSPVLDLGYLQLFKAIDAYRADLYHQASEALSTLNLSSVWETHGRSCCPRLLFHFRRAPRPLKRSSVGLKKLEHAVEDQLYFILRKTRIITNVCAKSLFAIPKNEEFVYISADEESNSARDVSALVKGLVELCNGTEPQVSSDRQSFKDFLQLHIDLAFAEGFDDNVGKYAMSTSFFELPSAKTWRGVANVLTPIYLDSDYEEPDDVLRLALATDVSFSRARCAKVLPIAQASYTEGLPSHYSSQHHELKLQQAMSVLDNMGRGPIAAGARKKLQSVAENWWRAHTVCEAQSLTGHPCVHPAHDSTKEHTSGVRYISACNCGCTKCSREDPYTVKKANYSFYKMAEKECEFCDAHQKIDFPIFEPSTESYRPASTEPEIENKEEKDCDALESPEDSAGAQTEPERLSAPEALSPTENEQFPNELDESLITTEKSISRQPSTTEYLPYMIHTESPVGLLPLYSSWSLVRVGRSMLYSHSAGLLETFQPGLLTNAKHLMPWDCPLQPEPANIFRPTVSAIRGRNKLSTHEPTTVKLFIGYEYECPRGHRFMAQTDSSGVSLGGSGATLASKAVSLYTSCGCRLGLVAQLARVHVVTPKHHALVALSPKVQPVPGGSIFTPVPVSEFPIKLTSAAYWVLRLPYIYCGERGPLPRPKTLNTPHQGVILPDMFSIIQ